MKLTVKRRFLGDSYTIGSLYIDGQLFCDTLEDKCRDLCSSMQLEEIRKKKIPSETAIPRGKYKVIVNYSPRFRRNLPRLLDVPGYDGILIHSGNTHKDTSGCILVGENKEKGKVLNSRYWEGKLLERLQGINDIEIEII